MVSDSGAVFQSNLFGTPSSLDMFFEIVCVPTPANLMIRAQPQVDPADSSFSTTSPQDALDNVFKLSYAKMIFPFGFEFDLQWCF